MKKNIGGKKGERGKERVNKIFETDRGESVTGPSHLALLKL